MASVVKGLCQGCMICVRTCPRGAISISGVAAVIDVELCDDCEECVFICPNGAIGG